MSGTHGVTHRTIVVTHLVTHMATDIADGIEELGERWGYVVVTYRPHGLIGNGEYIVANHTDEGLGPGTPVEARGGTLSEAIEAALNRNYSTWDA